MRRYLANEQQHPGECAKFCATLQREGVTSYLEIGSRFGGSLWQVAQALPKGSRLVAVDLENRLELAQCAGDLIALGYDVDLIIGDSTAPEVIAKVEGLGPFDAVLIDGNHAQDYVSKDWLNYGPMGRIVAFHDIGTPKTVPAHKPWKADPSLFWKSLRDHYRHIEILADDGIGFGVLWR